MLIKQKENIPDTVHDGSYWNLVWIGEKLCFEGSCVNDVTKFKLAD